MRVLLIDDEPESVEALKEELEALGLVPRVCDFADANELLLDWRPGAVVLDLLLGLGAAVEETGVETFDVIWKSRFCPIVVYSAEPERLQDPSHPFVKLVQKGSGSEALARAAIEELRTAAEDLQKVAHQLDLQLHQALKVVAPALFPSDDAAQLTRAVLRHLAARLDIDRFGSPLLQPEEQYVYPPVHDSLLTGDLLRRSSADVTDPSGYRLVLTPSCDLVASGGRSPKVTELLLAKCKPLSEIGARKKDPVERILRDGIENHLVVLPALGELIPTMVADLKSLELTGIESVFLEPTEDEEAYVRVASIDSPFREHVTWCYLQVAGRPGLPDRDVEEWAQKFRDDNRQPQDAAK